LSKRGVGTAQGRLCLPYSSVGSDLIAFGNAAAGDHLGIDAAIGMAEALHQRMRDIEVARGGVGIDVDGGATFDPLHDLQARVANDQGPVEQAEFVPGRPAPDIEIGAEAQRSDRLADDSPAITGRWPASPAW
jgi:hypothetical protein